MSNEPVTFDGYPGSAVIGSEFYAPPNPPAPRPDYDRRKAKRLMREGEIAREALIALPANVLATRDAAVLAADRVYRVTGDRSVSLDDILKWSDATLAKVGLRRQTVLDALEAQQELAEVRQHAEATHAALQPKVRLGIRVRDWINSNHRNVA